MTSPPEAHTAPVFTKFPDLPTELQYKIWHHAAHIPRDVVVHIGRMPEVPYQEIVFEYNAKTTPPAILHANQESRSEGRRVYVTCFSDESGSKFYLNPYIDTLFIADFGTYLYLVFDSFRMRKFLSGVCRNRLMSRLPPQRLSGSSWEGLNPVIAFAMIEPPPSSHVSNRYPRRSATLVIKNRPMGVQLKDMKVGSDLDRMGWRQKMPRSRGESPYTKMNAWVNDE